MKDSNKSSTRTHRRSRTADPLATKGAQANTERVAAASAFIRERLKEADAGLRAIGDYLLDEFFDGDPDTYAARERKDASLRALLKRAGTLEVPISKTALSNAIGLAVVTRQLGATSTFSQLPQSLPIELLPLRDTGAIELLAIDIDSSQMTVREVRQVVRDMKPKTAKGRPPKPRVVQAVEALVRVLGDGPSCRLELAPDEVAALSAEQRERALVVLGHMREHLAALHEALGAAEPSSDVGTTAGTRTATSPGADTAADRGAHLARLVTIL